jgi:hypothetical protein
MGRLGILGFSLGLAACAVACGGNDSGDTNEEGSEEVAALSPTKAGPVKVRRSTMEPRRETLMRPAI